MSNKLVSGKILLTTESTFDVVEDFLLEQGYSWIRKGKIRQSDIPVEVNMIFFYDTGILRFTSGEEHSPFWINHRNPTYIIKDAKLELSEKK